MATSTRNRRAHGGITVAHRALRLLLLFGLLLAPSTLAAQEGSAASSFSSSHAALGTGSSGPGRVPSDIANLRLAPGFTVRLSVLDDPDFAGTFRVDEHGNLNVPVLGRVHVEGETASDAEVHLQKMLLDGRLLKDPQIELTVVEFPEGEITVLGEVARPGLVAVHGARKLADVLALAGGTTVTAGNEVEISRGGTEEDSESIHYSLDPAAMETTFVRPGDTVLVKRAGIVYVLGAVNRPSGIVMQEKGTLDVLQAIALAGGTTQMASIGTIYLLRRQPDHSTKVIALPYKKMTRGKPVDDQLLAEDILFVPTNKIKMAYADVQGVITAVATVGVYTAAGY
jgi:polysaccharide export outer membrane protein